MLKAVHRYGPHTMPNNTLKPEISMSHWIEYVNIGLSEYRLAWNIQEEKHAKMVEAKENMDLAEFGGFLIFCEHPHVFTIGKSGQVNNLLIDDNFLKKINASYYKSNRGGDITYHGPGQIVGYPILDLEKLKLGVKIYVHNIEEAIIATLADFSINASRLDGATGVWLEAGTQNARKICAIGVRVSKAVTMHGFALNVNTDLSYFSYINPCGFIDKGVTSMEKELKQKPDIELVKVNLKEKICEYFSLIIR
jgi:lipoyl(octanoyl) transferase